MIFSCQNGSNVLQCNVLYVILITVVLFAVPLVYQKSPSRIWLGSFLYNLFYAYFYDCLTLAATDPPVQIHALIARYISSQTNSNGQLYMDLLSHCV